MKSKLGLGREVLAFTDYETSGASSNMKRHIRTLFCAIAILPVVALLIQTLSAGRVVIMPNEDAAFVALALMLLGGIGAYSTQRLMTKSDVYPFEQRSGKTER